MKKLRRLLALSLTTACFLLAGAMAKADSLAITLTPAYEVGVQSVFAFDATVTNNSGLTAYLNGDNYYVDPPLGVDDSPYDLDWPYTLASEPRTLVCYLTWTCPMER